MTALEQIRQGLNEVWSGVREGWQRLYQRAAGAMTRFVPGKRTGELATTAMTGRSSGWGLLAAEVAENDDALVVRLEVPGMKKGDFDIEVIDNYLVVRGEKCYSHDRDEGRYHIAERAYGVFERAIPLPVEIDPAGAKAKYKRGVLQVTLPKAASQRRRRIAVHSG